MSEFNSSFSFVFGSAESDVTRELARNLPEYYPSDPTSDNYGLLEPIGTQLDVNDNDIAEVEDAASVDNAKSIGELRKHGELVGLMPETGEPVDRYRARLKAEYALATSEGTIADILKTTARALEIGVDQITYTEPAGGENGTMEVGVPSNALDETSLTQADLGDIIGRAAPASYRPVTLVSGTFTYITPSEYNDGNHDASKGYDGLDANGDPKDNGGTYAGLLE